MRVSEGPQQGRFFPEAFGYEYIFPGASHLAGEIIIIRERYQGFLKLKAWALSHGLNDWPYRVIVSV